LDHIQIPKFESSEEYYSTLFHEIAHSTGHETRLNRKGVTESKKFGSHDYSYKELIAEISSAFLCNFVKIENTFDNSAAYIQGWSKILKDNKKNDYSSYCTSSKSFRLYFIFESKSKIYSSLKLLYFIL